MVTEHTYLKTDFSELFIEIFDGVGNRFFDFVVHDLLYDYKQRKRVFLVQVYLLNYLIFSPEQPVIFCTKDTSSKAITDYQILHVKCSFDYVLLTHFMENYITTCSFIKKIV